MEKWREVPGFKNYYINIDTPIGRCVKKYKNGHIRELNSTQKNGRVFWCLTNDKEEKFWQAARWIAITYPELVQNEYFEGAEICHEDNNALNNHPSNLKWGTHKENMNNPLTREKRGEISKGNKYHFGKKHSGEWGKWVIKLSTKNEILHFYHNCYQAERETGVNHQNICSVCVGKRKTAGGFIWKFAE